MVKSRRFWTTDILTSAYEQLTSRRRYSYVDVWNFQCCVSTVHHLDGL